MARAIELMTRNPRKLAEYVDRMSQYGVRVVQAAKDPDTIASRLAVRGTIAVMSEQSNLFDADGVRLEEHRHLQACVNRTALQVWTRNKAGDVVETRYERAIEGHIDLTRRAPGEDVFSWDDVFVARDTLQSYHQMRQRGLKLSARDLVISDWARDRLWYKRPTQLAWTPTPHRRSVDFSLDPVAFVQSHPLYSTLPADHFLRRVLGHTLAEGLFFRAAKNRREKNYWMPGLNAGVPFVPKRDDVHEATFMFHDLMHFAFPDLIFDGQTSTAHRNTYIVHRMMSEAFTLVLADMVFVDALRVSGLDYDFSSRRIHPLFASLKLEAASPKDLRKVLRANAHYCLMGDPSVYEALGADPAALDAFRGKYAQFFVSDYRWTDQNFRSMSRTLGARAGQWLDQIAPIRAALPFETPTVSDWVDDLRGEGVDFEDLDALVDACFARYMARLIHRAETPIPTDADARCLEHGFRRYMMGQLALATVFDFMPECGHYADKLTETLSAPGDLGPEGVARARGFFDQLVVLLGARRLISEDDRDVFREVYPIFAPFYVAYDVAVTTPLSQVARQIIQAPA